MAADFPDSDATRKIDDTLLGATLAPGQRVFGRYTLEKEIGRGGMGVVWRARDESLGETIALKFLPAAVARDAVSVDELKEETRKARRLSHANIVKVFDFVQDESRVAVSMEFVDGTTLAQLRLQQPGKVFSPEVLAPFAAQICAALDHAHREAKVVHRDLKPANVLVTRDGVAKLADFGIARSLTETQTRLTGKAGTSGTLLYMSPQQWRGLRAAPADDLYALGAMLYELLGGKPPFFTGEIVHQILRETPEPLSTRRAALAPEAPALPRAWVETIAACLAKEPGDRPPTAAAVADRLRGERGTVDGPAPRRRSLWRGLAGGAAALAAVLAVAFWPKGETKPIPAGPAPVAEAPKRGDPDAKPAQPAAPLVKPAEDTPTDGGPNSGGSTVLVARADPAGIGSVERRAKAAAPALVAGFVVSVDPPDAGARLWLGPQSDLAVPADGRARVPDLPDGEHELIVQAPGYQPLTTRVTVKDGRGSAEAKLVAVKGSVEVVARAGTIVTAIDARGRETRVGTVPAGGVLSSANVLTIGSYQFRLTHPDCPPVEVKSAELAIGRPAKIAPPQTPLPGELRVFSVPSGAEVAVNGKALGPTPATLRNQPSETPLAVEVFARGYRRSSQTVSLKPRETRTLNVGTLVGEAGAVELRMADFGSRIDGRFTVRIDGKAIEVGRVVLNAPLRAEGLEVGSRSVEITHPDYEPWQQRVAVRDQETTAVDVKLAPKPGRLALRAEPREIGLTVNGRAVRPEEIRNGELTLPAGEPITIMATAKGHQPATRRFTLAANGSETWDVALELQRFPQAGQPWENTLGMKFVPVPGADVLFGIWTVRVKDYEAFAHATRREGSKPGFEQGATHPAVNVSWEDAQAFCAWLTKTEQAEDRLGPNQKYRLPTDAEWSLAAELNEPRGGSPASKDGGIKGVYPWGTPWPPPRGAGNYASTLNVDEFANTSPVGSFAANKFGLFDMGGNVWQWCDDFYDGSSGARVLRGASFNFSGVAGYMLSSGRYDLTPYIRDDNIGFVWSPWVVRRLRSVTSDSLCALSLLLFSLSGVRGGGPDSKNLVSPECRLHGYSGHQSSSGGRRVLRGASFNNNEADNLLSSNRNNNPPDNRNDNIGFRCVVAVGGASAPKVPNGTPKTR